MAFTYFFRDVHTLNLAAKHLVPFVSGRSRIGIWDAGCAMGQEPYTMAIILAESLGKFAFRNLRIDATDIDGSNRFDEIIASGTYLYEELQRIPKDLFDKYFHPADNPECYQIDDTLRNKLSFRKHDLLSLQPPGSEYCLIICKNVLLHFQYAERIEVIKMFHKSLTIGGFFVTEQTQKLPREVEHLFKQVTPDAQLFQKIEAE